MTEYEAKKAEILALAEAHGAELSAVFVPFSQSRNAANDPGNKPGSRSLNWKFTIRRNGVVVLETDYSAGVGHCPGYKQGARWTLDYTKIIVDETETGKSWTYGQNTGRCLTSKSIPVDLASMLASLANNADVLNYGSFEEWAENFGYDPDSRKAETVYNACLAISLQLRRAFGDVFLTKLRELANEL